MVTGNLAFLDPKFLVVVQVCAFMPTRICHETRVLEMCYHKACSFRAMCIALTVLICMLSSWVMHRRQTAHPSRST